MAYVSSYDYDIFISYAHVDNTTLTNENTGWIDIFHKLLQITLDRKIGQANVLKIWRDKKLDGNQYFDQTISEVIKKSAIFIACISNGYLNSGYCKKELDLFHSNAIKQSTGLIVENYTRIFSLLLSNISYELLPDAIKGHTSFVFHDAEPGEGMGFGFPIDPDKKLFRTQMKSLANAIFRCLNQMNMQNQEGSASKKQNKIKEQFSPIEINYNINVKSIPESIPIGGISTITIYLELFGTNSDPHNISISKDDTDLCLFLDIPDAFEILGPSALSIPIKHSDEHPDQSKTIHKMRFKLRAISPSSSPITLELSTHSGTKKKISIPLEVTEIDQSSLFSDSISLKSRPVPHPDNILRIEPVYDATNSLISFHYLIRGSVTTNGESISFSSRSLPSGWLKNLKVLLTMAINAKNGSSEEKCKHLASLGQELSYHLCPNKLWSLLTKPYAKTLLILYPDNIWLPWEFMHDGDTFLCQRLIISRWPRKLNDQRPFEIPVERINLAHFAGVDQLENWKALLQLPENNAPEVKILPFDFFSDQPLLTEEKSSTLHGLHLIRQSVISMETDNFLPITKQEKTCDKNIKNEGNENDQKIDIGQSKHYMSSIRPLVSFSYLDSGEPTLTNLEKRWAASFITSGASAFVGPIWPVKQDVDVSFLRGFYTYLWMGKSLGAAFQNGQQLAKTANPDTLDWMAYTLYGDPMARPYRPAKGEGYAVVQPIGRDINDSVQPGEKIRFSVSLQCSPPIWHDGRLVEISETLAYDNLQAHIGTFNLLIDSQHPVKMHKMGDDYRGWFTLQIPEQFAEDSSLVQIQLTDHDEPLHIVSFSLNIEKKQNDSREVFDA
jgi:hypothetical protein